MATTNLLADIDKENGFPGRLTVTTDHSASGVAGWMCRVESQDAEMTSECSLLKTTLLTPAS